MGKRIQLVSHLSVDELDQRARQAREATERSRWQIVWLLGKQHTAREIAESTGYSPYWIGQIAKRYNAEGPAGMINRRHTTARRAPMLLSSAWRSSRSCARRWRGRRRRANAGPAARWPTGWRSAWVAPSLSNAAGTTCSAWGRACATPALGTSRPAPRISRRSKKSPHADAGGGDRVS